LIVGLVVYSIVLVIGLYISASLLPNIGSLGGGMIGDAG
jgi:hypothetical protein